MLNRELYQRSETLETRLKLALGSQICITPVTFVAVVPSNMSTQSSSQKRLSCSLAHVLSDFEFWTVRLGLRDSFVPEIRVASLREHLLLLCSEIDRIL